MNLYNNFYLVLLPQLHLYPEYKVSLSRMFNKIIENLKNTKKYVKLFHKNLVKF